MLTKLLTQVPPELLQQAVMGQVPMIQPFNALAELNNRIKKQAMIKGMANEQAMQSPTPPTVAQQVMMMGGGLGATAPSFAGGGLVAFADGGDVESDYFQKYDEEIDQLGQEIEGREEKRKSEILGREAERAPLIAAQQAEIQRRRALAEQRKQEIERRKQEALAKRKFDPSSANSIAAMANAMAGEKRLGAGLARAAGALAKQSETAKFQEEEVSEKARGEIAALEKEENARRDLELAINERAYAARIGDREAVSKAEDKIAEAKNKLLTARRDAARLHQKDKNDERRAQIQDRMAGAAEARARAAETRAQQSHNMQMKEYQMAGVRAKALANATAVMKLSPDYRIALLNDPPRAQQMLDAETERQLAQIVGSARAPGNSPTGANVTPAGKTMSWTEFVK